MAVNFSGKWMETQSENWDEYLKEAGLPPMPPKPPGQRQMSMEIVHEGDSFTVKKPCGEVCVNFTIGQEFEHSPPFPGAKKMKCVPQMEGDKLVVTSDAGSGKTNVMTREIVGDELIMAAECGNVQARKVFKREN